jgi:hypothetical protein
MAVCWALEPNRRPSFDKLRELVLNVIATMERDQAESAALNRHYEQVSSFRTNPAVSAGRTTAVVTPV